MTGSIWPAIGDELFAFFYYPLDACPQQGGEGAAWHCVIAHTASTLIVRRDAP